MACLKTTKGNVQRVVQNQILLPQSIPIFDGPHKLPNRSDSENVSGELPLDRPIIKMEDEGEKLSLSYEKPAQGIYKLYSETINPIGFSIPLHRMKQSVKKRRKSDFSETTDFLRSLDLKPCINETWSLDYGKGIGALKQGILIKETFTNGVKNKYSNLLQKSLSQIKSEKINNKPIRSGKLNRMKESFCCRQNVLLEKSIRGNCKKGKNTLHQNTNIQNKSFNDKTMEGKSTPKRRSRTLANKIFDKEELLQPLLQGWKREVVTRATSSDKRDVYYFSPCGRKLRSSKQLEKFLIEKGSPFMPKHFSFAQVLMGYEEPYETSRISSIRVSDGNKTSPKKNTQLKCEKITSYLEEDNETHCMNSFQAFQSFSKTSANPSSDTSLKEVREAAAAAILTEAPSPGKKLEKEILYVEELNEEDKPPLSVKQLPDGTEDSKEHLRQFTPHPPDKHHSLPSVATHSIFSDPSLGSGKGNLFSLAERESRVTFPHKDSRKDKPMIPVFQLTLDSSYEEMGEERDVTSSSDSTLLIDNRVTGEYTQQNSNLDDPDSLKMKSLKIRVRPIAELCRSKHESSSRGRSFNLQKVEQKFSVRSNRDFVSNSPIYQKNEIETFSSTPLFRTVYRPDRSHFVAPIPNNANLNQHKYCDSSIYIDTRQIPVHSPTSFSYPQNSIPQTYSPHLQSTGGNVKTSALSYGPLYNASKHLLRNDTRISANPLFMNSKSTVSNSRRSALSNARQFVIQNSKESAKSRHSFEVDPLTSRKLQNNNFSHVDSPERLKPSGVQKIRKESGLNIAKTVVSNHQEKWNEQSVKMETVTKDTKEPRLNAEKEFSPNTLSSKDNPVLAPSSAARLKGPSYVRNSLSLPSSDKILNQVIDPSHPTVMSPVCSLNVARVDSISEEEWLSIKEEPLAEISSILTEDEDSSTLTTNTKSKRQNTEELVNTIPNVAFSLLNSQMFLQRPQTTEVTLDTFKPVNQAVTLTPKSCDRNPVVFLNLGVFNLKVLEPFNFSSFFGFVEVCDEKYGKILGVRVEKKGNFIYLPAEGKVHFLNRFSYGGNRSIKITDFTLKESVLNFLRSKTL